MNRFIKKLLTVTILFSIAAEASADRGIGRKSKNRTILNVNAASNLKNSIGFNLKNGLSYKATLFTSHKSVNSTMNTAIVTYQKGNTTYIIPYKNKITVTEIKPGYTGMKIIIRKK